MTFPFHPVRSLRQVVNQIGHAVNASAEYSHAARQREAALLRGDRPAVQPISF